MNRQTIGPNSRTAGATPFRAKALLFVLADDIATTANLLRVSAPDITTWRLPTEDSVHIELSPFESSDRWQYEVADTHILSIDNCILFGNMPVVVSDHGLVLESAQANIESLYHHLLDCIETNGFIRSMSSAMRARTSVKDRCRNDESIVFPLVCTNGYYHWLFEYLPKIRALRYYQQQTGDSPSVLIRPNPPRWMRESLSLLGISKKRRVQWDRLQSPVKKAIVSTHRVHLPRREYGRYEPCRTAYQWLKSEAVAGITAKQQLSNRIFISREDTNRRNIANDTEIYDVLRDFGFEPYVLSDYRFEEQVAMFRNATAVVGVHGAGLSNIVFGDNIDVLEIVPQDMRRITYCCLSKILNHTYQVMHTPAPVENLVLDPDNLSQKLNQIT